MSEQQYDGIQENNNPMPEWWIATFLGTLIFGFIYWIHFMFGGGLTQEQELALEQSHFPKKNVKIWTDQDLSGEINESKTARLGALVFAGKCASCHGPEGRGVIGPNLTDAVWIHGQGQPAEIANVISQGVLEKGMPAWETLITPDELKQVSIFVYSLKAKK